MKCELLWRRLDKNLFDAFTANNTGNKKNDDMDRRIGDCIDYSHADLQDENDKLGAANNAKDKALFNAKSCDIEKLIEMNLLLFKTVQEKNKKLSALAAVPHDDIRNGGSKPNVNGIANTKGDDDIINKANAEIKTPHSITDDKNKQGFGTKSDNGKPEGGRYYHHHH